MKLEVIRLANYPVTSNCFIVWLPNENNNCIIIDPGSLDSVEIDSIIKQYQLTLDLIFITHEHFDHIWCVDQLRDKYHCALVASDKASEYITNPKKNLSLFYDGKGFQVGSADIVISENTSLLWCTYDIMLYKTPGHSEGGMCISIDDFIFVGDLLLKGLPPCVKLPGGNRTLWYNSVKCLIKECLTENCLIKCGHGEDMNLQNIML